RRSLATKSRSATPRSLTPPNEGLRHSAYPTHRWVNELRPCLIDASEVASPLLVGRQIPRRVQETRVRSNRVGHLVGPDPETRQRVGAERGADGDVGRVAA